MEYRILIVDDEEDILEIVSYNLRQQGWVVSTARSGLEALRVSREFCPHLILLDVMMPDMDGITACREFRCIDELSGVLIAMLTARGEDYSQIAGFEAGADDYISKPIRPAVLISRIRALLKRIDTSSVTSVVSDGLGVVIDYDRHVAIVDGEVMELPRKEFALLGLLLSKPERVFTREEIYSSVWGDEIVVGDRTIDVHIRKLRGRLGDSYIQTVKGVGYKFTYGK